MQTQETNSAVNGAINSTQYSNNVNSGKQQKGENGNPLFMIGFVKNRRTYVNEINELLEGTGVTVSVGDINLMVETNGFDNRNIHGYSRESDGTQIAPANVHYKLVKTGWSTKEGREIVGWFTKSKKGFEGITWGTEASFISSVANSRSSVSVSSTSTNGVMDCHSLRTWHKVQFLKSGVISTLLRT